MLLPPFIGCLLAVCFLATIVIGFREGVMPGNSQWLWESDRKKHPVAFWIAILVYTLAFVFFAGDALWGFAHG